MKGEKDEKTRGPVFPRLHVNDADKGGPRAPPRNKMSLYEQLSISSHRFIQAASTSVHPPTQGVVKERGALFSPRSQNNYTHQCPDLNTPLTGIEQGKKSDESGCTAPIFVHSVPNSHLKSPEICFEKESRNRKDENSEKTATDRIKPTENPEVSAGYKPDSRSNMASISEENFAVVEKRKDPNLARSFFPPEAQKVLHDTSNEAGFRTLHTRGLDRVVGLSEDSVVDLTSRVDLTRDDVVGIIGQKHFWKARRVIMNQQRIFALQVFELHRLIKVQRLIAASPHLLRDDMAYFNRPIKASHGKRKQLNICAKETPFARKPKGEPEKPILIRNKSSVENGTEHKASCSSVQTGVPPPNMRPGNSQAPSMNSAYNPGTWGFNPQLGRGGLILVMSPEGLDPSKFVHK